MEWLLKSRDLFLQSFDFADDSRLLGYWRQRDGHIYELIPKNTLYCCSLFDEIAKNSTFKSTQENVDELTHFREVQA